MSSRLIGTYGVLNGGLYLLNGAFLTIYGASYIGSAPILGGIGAIFGVGYILFAMLMLMAGGGIMTERAWARYLGIGLFGLDFLEKSFSVFLAGDMTEILWLFGSFGAMAYLAFGDPYDSVPRPDVDEDTDVHRLGGLRR